MTDTEESGPYGRTAQGASAAQGPSGARRAGRSPGAGTRAGARRTPVAPGTGGREADGGERAVGAGEPGGAGRMAGDPGETGGTLAAELRPVRPLTVSRLPDRVADQIREFIVAEDLAENTRLPAERDLAARFGTSRPTVSQALRTLSLMGLVEIRPGSGAYVVHRPDRAMTATVELMLDLDRDSVPHLARLRLWLETVAVREAVRAVRENPPAAGSATRPGTGSGADRGSGAGAGTDFPAGARFADVHHAFDRLRESTGNVSAWIAADTVFHAAIVRRSGNPFLTSIYESVHTAVIRYEYEPWIRSQSMPPWLAPGEAERLLAVHEPIRDAVEAGDEGAALEAVRRHHAVMMANLETR
ncbi:FadR/GntR family transcriptional regulator [Streptomyces sp. NPDC051018]|uniref:FadR/GntR family transcriptional regulator n=1 Tax=Streptomyces sp. NPDC051018 TaxID=3365639 RepID=UPI0037AD5613